MYCARGGASMPMSCSARVDERHLVGEARQPVDAVDQRGDLRVGAELGELLVAAVHVADHRVGRDDALAVEAHDEAQRAVGRRVLRPEVEDHVAGVELDADLRVGEVPERARVDVELGQRRVRWCSRGRPPRRLRRRRRRRRRRHRAWARRRRGPATASRPATAAGSPCAAGDPRTPTGGRGGAARGGRRTRSRTSPSTRARASRRPAYTGTHDCDEHATASSTSALSVRPQWRRGGLHVREHLEAALGAGGAVGGLGRLHRRRRVAAGVVATLLRRRHPVDARR